MLQLDPLERLEPANISLRWRRIASIKTTCDRFQIGEEINKLYASGANKLFVTLQGLGMAPEPESGCEYAVDI